jgi:hypothetical protein
MRNEKSYIQVKWGNGCNYRHSRHDHLHNIEKERMMETACLPYLLFYVYAPGYSQTIVGRIMLGNNAATQKSRFCESRMST